MMQTAFAEQFERRGLIPREVALKAALALFFNNGGSIERAHALIDSVADKMGSGGHVTVVRSGQTINADASQQNESAGHFSGATDANKRLPALSTERSGGQTISAEKASGHSPSAATRRDGAGPLRSADKAIPSVPRPVSPLYLAAARRGAQQIALTVLDSYRVRDGRAIGDLTFGELVAMRGANIREASVLKQIKNHVANAESNLRVRDAIKPDVLEKMIQRAAEVEDAL